MTNKKNFSFYNIQIKKTNLHVYSRGDLSLHEDENENQQGRKTAGKHHPDGEVPVGPQRTNEPTTFVPTGHRETSGNTQFLEKKKKKKSSEFCHTLRLSRVPVTVRSLVLTCVYVSFML